MELAFTTFYYSSHLGLVGALELGAQDFRIRTFNILNITIITFFFIIIFSFFKVQGGNINEACIC